MSFTPSSSVQIENILWVMYALKPLLTSHGTPSDHVDLPGEHDIILCFMWPQGQNEFDNLAIDPNSAVVKQEKEFTLQK